MGLFSSDTPDLSRRAKTEIWSQFGLNRTADEIIGRIQSQVLGQIGQGFDVGQAPRQVPQDNALLQLAGQQALNLFNPTAGGFGSALQGAVSDSLTQSGASLLDPALFNQFFEASVANPAQRDFRNALSQASNFVAGIGGERSGGFGSILGDTALDFGTNLLGQRAALQGGLAQQGAQLEAQRLNRISSGGIQSALAPIGFLAGLGENQFNREGLAGSEEFNRFLLSQPFSNPFVTTFLNAAVGARNPGAVLSAG